MKIEDKRKNGFVLILVITAMAVVGIEMFALAGVANIMLFQSDTAYLQACRRNLLVSGLAWAKRNIQDNSGEALNKTIELDVTERNIRRSTLGVTISVPTDKEPEVQISTSCSRHRRTLRSSDKHRIER